MREAEYHLPVMPAQVLEALAPRRGGRFVDGTLGGGGHATLVAEVLGPAGHLFGIDQDPEALAAARGRLAATGTPFSLVQGNFADVLAAWPDEPVEGILLDLGVSSHQLDTAARGFSFQREGPLDMRMDPQGPTTAADLVNRLEADDLAQILFRYGEERHARRIARALIERRQRRPFATTEDLAAAVAHAMPRPSGRLHPATRTFQALRIAVNDELGALERVLPRAIQRLAPGGRLAVISFHSLEDRLVKHFMRAQANPCVCPPRCPRCVCDRQPTLVLEGPQPRQATADEISQNPRARSAKLRVAKRI